ncbi:MAG: PEGA domain-containing protein [Candidatus Marinimicrobia bacterium]|jgi:hypothetical protein|nr:PEGA domain-containing protein [Candidatus Neomarinimicrobiota bacterium]MBT3937955.1 PEGA domain-containing protein [Candidatus Neomarinimicrobiota bacterium]MBT3962213.1 PEGA domain-containing protein [Candidatus Neomarinimicrobiota bacterium]MBT4383786.1 PEGA domain-containing protein [Candidatus Neomarinimicrobiota bacterium]MBT4636922.1 PEGA domain-containing protein [Candidatus Neomarinimicrobiota bacterium]
MKIDIKKIIPLLLVSILIGQVRLSLVTIPRPANVYIDGEQIGRTPIDQYKIRPGEHQIQIIAKGYAPILYPMIINESKAVNLEFFLNPVYDIKFKTDHKDLTFKLNKEHEWNKQKIKLQIEAGDHELQVYRKGVLIDTRGITVDQPATIRYHLNKNPDDD